jgi:carbon monoxide dehydrogenase subunit G
MVGRRVVDEQARKIIARAFACLRRNVAAVASPS